LRAPERLPIELPTNAAALSKARLAEPAGRPVAEARKRPGIAVIVFDRLRDAEDVAADLRELASEKGVTANVKAHANGAVEVVVPEA
jgi:hypothetical protein